MLLLYPPLPRHHLIYPTTWLINDTDLPTHPYPSPYLPNLLSYQSYCSVHASLSPYLPNRMSY